MIGDFEEVLTVNALKIFVRPIFILVSTLQTLPRVVTTVFSYVRKSFSSSGKLSPGVKILLIITELLIRINIFRYFGGKVGVHSYIKDIRTLYETGADKLTAAKVYS